MTIHRPMFPPPLAANVFSLPSDPDAIRAIIKLGRHLDDLERRLAGLWQAPSNAPSFRQRIEDVVEGCINALDMLGPDPDLEDEREDDTCDAEADLGWSMSYGQAGLMHGDEGGEDERRGEPSLGSLDCAVNQDRWAYGTPNDLEDEHDGSEPDEDGEPTLGWTIGYEFGGDADGFLYYVTHDGELEPELGL